MKAGRIYLNIMDINSTPNPCTTLKQIPPSFSSLYSAWPAAMDTRITWREKYNLGALSVCQVWIRFLDQAKYNESQVETP